MLSFVRAQQKQLGTRMKALEIKINREERGDVRSNESVKESRL